MEHGTHPERFGDWYGGRALLSLRLEQAWGVWTLDYRPDFTAAESGLYAHHVACSIALGYVPADVAATGSMSKSWPRGSPRAQTTPRHAGRAE